MLFCTRDQRYSIGPLSILKTLDYISHAAVDEIRNVVSSGDSSGDLFSRGLPLELCLH